MRQETSRSIYLQSVLTERIIFGKYPLGSRLPSAQELMKEFKVSRSTLKRGLDYLESIRLISRKNGCSPTVIESSRAIHRRSESQYRIALIRDMVRDGLRFPFHRGPWTWTLQELLQQHLLEKHIPTVIIGSSDIERHAELLKNLSGCVYLCPHYLEQTHRKLVSLGIRHITLTAYCENPPPANIVCYDFDHANDRAACYLLLHGMKTLDIIASPQEDGRLNSFYRLLHEWNFPEEAIHRMALETIEDHLEIEERYRSIPPEWQLPAGIVCYRERHAVLVFSLLLRHGLRPKQDFRLFSLGKDLMPTDMAGSPAISGYSSSLPELADHAISMLYDLIESGCNQPNYRCPIDFQICDT